MLKIRPVEDLCYQNQDIRSISDDSSDAIEDDSEDEKVNTVHFSRDDANKGKLLLLSSGQVTKKLYIAMSIDAEFGKISVAKPNNNKMTNGNEQSTVC